MALTQISSDGIENDSIVNADIKSDAAIALSKLASTPAVLTGSTNNTICTVTGANAIQGEANLTFDGTNLSLTGEFDLSGDIRISDTIKHTGDVDTKIRFPAADTFSVEAGAVEKLRIEGDYAGTVDVKGIPAHLRLYSQRNTDDWDATDPIGKLDYYVGSDTSNNLPYNAGFIHCLNETDNANEPSGALVFGTSTANASGGAVERLRIDSSGRLGIGTTSPGQPLHLKAASNATTLIQIEASPTGDGTAGFIGCIAGANNLNNGSLAGELALRGSSGISFSGNEGSATQVRINQHGLLFGSDTASANALDDYEEGTYTATLTCLTSGTITVNSSNDQLYYTKIGRVVYVTGRISVSAVSSPNGVQLRLNLPIVSAAGTEESGRVIGWVQVQGAAKDVQDYTSQPTAGGNTYIQIGFSDNTIFTGDICGDINTSTKIAVNFHYVT